MHVRFWGTRGSLPKPGRDTLRFGGNTSCIEVRTSSNTLLILDCGSGLHALGQALKATGRPVENGHILISHTHWDHIQGIPFFAPFFEPGGKWQVYAPRGLGQSVEDTLAGQMQYSYFPVRLDQMAADIHFHELLEGSFRIDDVEIKTHYMNHTSLTLGFRIEVDGAVLVYATDHEPFDPQLASGQGEIAGRDRQHCEFLRGADLVIHDAQFTAEEYPDKVGWGHSTIEYATTMARAAGAARLALTHHDPLRSDDALDKLVRDARESERTEMHYIDIFAAAEGGEIELKGRAVAARAASRVPDSQKHVSALVNPSLVLAVDDTLASQTIREAATSDGITVIEANDADQALEIARASMPAVAIIEIVNDGFDRLRSAQPAHNDHNAAVAVPIVVVTDEAHLSVSAETREAPGIDVLSKPFSAAYARTFIRASLLRTACRWQRALSAFDEERRIELLHQLKILDTPPEERFDRLTRLAASIFDVPMALISLVDRERQWFKSNYGLKVRETSRETSFCAHAVSARSMLIVPDTFQDPRFSDNPLVSGSHRVRFYAGYPLFVDDCCVGTLCILDYRPRQLDRPAVGLLRDLAALAEGELVSKA